MSAKAWALCYQGEKRKKKEGKGVGKDGWRMEEVCRVEEVEMFGGVEVQPTWRAEWRVKSSPLGYYFHYQIHVRWWLSWDPADGK